MGLGSWRRAWLIGFAVVLAAPTRGIERGTAAPAPPPPAVQAGSAILVDADTGTVLFAQNADQRRPMASTTKIMTAIVILDYGHLDQMVTVSERAAQAGQSSVWLQPGEQLTLGDLLKGILIKSGNDAAVAAAEHVAGSEPAFVEAMNARARALGATDTHFVNPHGLYHPDHYSTARDLAAIARHAMRNATFRRIAGSKTAVIANSREPWDRLLRNHNQLLWQMPEADGIKTGYVKESGRCLVFSATRNEWRLIGVLLESPKLFEEARALLEHGFAAYRQIGFARAGERVGRAAVSWGARPVSLVAAQELSVVVPRAATARHRSEMVINPLRAPIRKGQQVGRLDLLRDGKPIESVALTAGADVPRVWWMTALLWSLRGGGALAVGALILRWAFRTSRRRRGRGSVRLWL